MHMPNASKLVPHMRAAENLYAARNMCAAEIYNVK